KTFFNDFKKQKRDVQTATTKILLENFVSTKQDFKKIKNGYFNCMWRNNEPLSIQSQFNFGFEYDNGNLIYQNRSEERRVGKEWETRWRTLTLISKDKKKVTIMMKDEI